MVNFLHLDLHLDFHFPHQIHDAKDLKKNDPEADRKIRDFMCKNFYDIRTFGAVMTTFVKAKLNCG